jgi:hypothetical protein
MNPPQNSLFPPDAPSCEHVTRYRHRQHKPCTARDSVGSGSGRRLSWPDDDVRWRSRPCWGSSRSTTLHPEDRPAAAALRAATPDYGEQADLFAALVDEEGTDERGQRASEPADRAVREVDRGRPGGDSPAPGASAAGDDPRPGGRRAAGQPGRGAPGAGGSGSAGERPGDAPPADSSGAADRDAAGEPGRRPDYWRSQLRYTPELLDGPLPTDGQETVGAVR